MIFYRRLSLIKAISFDLDDTLYSNAPIMRATEEKMVEYFSVALASFSTTIDQPRSFTYRYWFTFRQQALKNNPELIHDVAALRLVSYTLGMEALGITPIVAKDLAQKALAYFTRERSAFELPEKTHEFLQQLSENIPLIAITNGNVDVEAIGIKKYFSAVYHAADGLKQKPNSQMFDLACKNINISPKALLHVGDCGRADIAGAMRAGCQAAWLPKYDVGKPLTVLPHIELNHVDELLTFIN